MHDLFDLTEPVDNIVSNVPYGIAERCVRHMLILARRKVAHILLMTFWESERRDLFFREHPSVRWFVCATRPSMPPGVMSGERDRYGAIIQPPSSGGTMPYGWLERGFKGITSALRLPLRDRQREAPLRPVATSSRVLDRSRAPSLGPPLLIRQNRYRPARNSTR